LAQKFADNNASVSLHSETDELLFEFDSLIAITIQTVAATADKMKQKVQM